MVRRGSFIGGQDNLSVPDAPTIGAATAASGQVSVAFTAPSDVGDDPITGYGASATDGTNVIGGTGSSSPITITGLTNGTSYTAQVWAINDYGNGPLSAATSSFTPALARALFIGMKDNSGSGANKEINYITVTTTGDAADFGDTIDLAAFTAASGSDTRALFYEGSKSGGYSDIISYVTIASLGNATDFGDISEDRGYSTSTSNNVRSMHFSGYTSGGVQNKVEYVTIASTGDSTDFGDLAVAKGYQGACGSSTRAVVGGGLNAAGAALNVIGYFTISSAGNATDFGDLSVARTCGALSSSTRGIWGGGYTGSNSDVIDYVTIASTGNATDFGNLTVARVHDPAGVATSTRGVFAGGQNQNVIDYITIASTGNATDFGDLRGVASQKIGGHCSDEASVQNESYFAPASIGLHAGGVEPVNSVVQSLVSYINIATDGEAAMFGDLSAPRQSMFSGGMASSTRAVFGAGGINASPYYVDIIDFFTFSTKGKATDFGNATVARTDGASLSNSTRGLMAGGSASSASDVVDYITIASAGNAIDFGDTNAAYGQQGAAASTTRGLVAGGKNPAVNTIDYYTIASTGNAIDFGDLTVARRGTPAGLSSNTRAVFGGGNTGSASDVMDYVTIASTSNAIDFGNLTAASLQSAGLSNKTQGLYTAWGSSGTLNVDKITIASLGDATDWGENIHKNYGIGSASNSHGGIS